MDWNLADEFAARLIADGHRITLWESDLIHTALSGGVGDVAERWDTPAVRLLRSHFAGCMADRDTLAIDL